MDIQLPPAARWVRTTSSMLDSGVSGDGCTDRRFPTPFLKTAISHNVSLQYKEPRESPMKVFGRMKAKIKLCEQSRASENIQTRMHMPTGNNNREKGAAFLSPRKGHDDPWTMDSLLGHPQEFTMQYDDAEVLTLSPTSFPLSEFTSNDLPLRSPMKNKGIFHNQEINKVSSGKEEFRNKELRVSLEKLPLMTPNKILAKMKERERRRLERETFEVSSTMLEAVDRDHISQPQDESMFSIRWQDNIRIDGTAVPAGSRLPLTELGVNLEAFDSQSATGSEENVLLPSVKRLPVPSEGPLPSDLSHTHVLRKQLYVYVEKLPPVTPNSLVALVKERERRRQEREACEFGGSIKEFKNEGPQQKKSTSTISNVHENEDSASHLVLINEPLILNTPRIAFTNKRKAVFRNKTESSGFRHEEQVKGISLKNWTLKCNKKGLYVDGQRKDNSLPWHSNIIAERVTNSVLTTVSGSTYILIGTMNMKDASTLPRWLLKKFYFGFPKNWDTFYQKFLAESKEVEADCKRGKERARKQHGSGRTVSSVSLKQPGTTSGPHSSVNSTISGEEKLSRSGRVIRPPLEYWKGGRTILGADMNVTVYNCYETTIQKPDHRLDSTRETRGKPCKSSRTARIFNCCSDEQQQSEEISSEDGTAAPLRKVRQTSLHHSRARANPVKSTTSRTAPPKEQLAPQNSSIEDDLSSDSRSRRLKRPVTEAAPKADLVASRPRKSFGQSKCSTVPQRKPQSSPARSDSPVVSDALTKKRPPKRSQNPSSSQSKLKLRQKGTSSSEEHSGSETQTNGKGWCRRDAVRSRKARDTGLDIKTDESEHSDDFVKLKKKTRGKRQNSKRRKNMPVVEDSESDQSPSSLLNQSRSSLEVDSKALSKSGTSKKLNVLEHKKSSSPKPLQKLSQTKTKCGKTNADVSVSNEDPEEKDEEEWTEMELARLHEAVRACPKHMLNFWMKVASMVGTRSAGECQQQYTAHETFKLPAKKAKKESPIKQTESPRITARAGTLKRKQQVRQFLESLPKDNHDDIFSSTPMQKKRFQLPTESSVGEHDFVMRTDQHPLTPGSMGFNIVKTPQNLHVTPGMMGSVNRNTEDQINFQVQRRMRKDKVDNFTHNVPSKNFTPTPLIKRTTRRCENTDNDGFIIWKMFSDDDENLIESGEEEDYYFTDD